MGTPDTAPRTIRLGGHDHAYRRAGAGEPVVLLHGITTHSILWKDVLPGLAAHHDVVALDLLGCGESSKPLEPSYALTVHAERTAAVVEALGLGPVHLVGHDVGGGICQILAVRRPELVRTLTLVNTVGYDRWPVQPITALRTPIVRQILLAALDLGAFALLVRHGTFHRDRVTPALLADLTAPLLSEEGRRAFVHFARSLDNSNLMDIVPQLPGLRMPVSIVWGMADPFLSFEIAERLHRDVGHSRLFRIATASHFVPLDDPERLLEILAEVLHG
jgi:2-hydroxymuconate-semialdehyde hydrolase